MQLAFYKLLINVMLFLHAAAWDPPGWHASEESEKEVASDDEILL